MFGDHFYNETIRRYTSVFASLFTNLKIKRGNDIIPVPLTYAKGDPNVEHSRNSNGIGKNKKVRLTPRMGFDVALPTHAPNRASNKNNVLQVDGGQMYNRVPYDFPYTLYIKVKNVDELHQIIEQIFPYFTPYLNVTLIDNEDANIKTDVKITLDAGDGDIEYTDNQKEVSAVLQFTLEGFLYKPKSIAVPINDVSVVFEDDTSNSFTKYQYTITDGNVVTVKSEGLL